MVLVYGRVPVQMALPKGQEARFSIYYHDARALTRSRLIQAGDIVLKDIYCIKGTPEKTPVAESYWHIWFQDSPGKYAYTFPSQKHFQDYGTAAVDPDGKTFWSVHPF
jgi:hypothetical protein